MIFFFFLFLFSFSSLMKMSQRWNTFSSVVAQHCSPLIIIIKTRLHYTVYTINTKSVLSQVQKYLISRLCFKNWKKKKKTIVLTLKHPWKRKSKRALHAALHSFSKVSRKPKMKLSASLAQYLGHSEIIQRYYFRAWNVACYANRWVLSPSLSLRHLQFPKCSRHAIHAVATNLFHPRLLKINRVRRGRKLDRQKL